MDPEKFYESLDIEMKSANPPTPAEDRNNRKLLLIALLGAGFGFLLVLGVHWLASPHESRKPTVDATITSSSPTARPKEIAQVAQTGLAPEESTLEDRSSPAPVEKSEPAVRPDISAAPPTEASPEPKPPEPKPPEPKRAPAEGTVILADQTLLHLEKWGETYEAFKWKAPLRSDDRSIRTVMAQYHHPMVLDPERRNLYWKQPATGSRHHEIWRGSLQGSKGESLVDGIVDLRGLSIDSKRKKMYWVDLRGGPESGVYQAGTDGAGAGPLSITGQSPETPLYTSVDQTTGVVYYSYGNAIVQINPETKVESRIVQVRSAIHTLHVFGERAEIYFATVESDVNTGWRCGLDGTGLTKLFEIEGTSHGWNFAIDWETKKIYWSSRDKIRRGNLDGTQREDLLIRPKSDSGMSIAIDPHDRMLYFADSIGNDSSRFARMPIPPLLEPQTKPAPPHITGIEPVRQIPGGNITLTGKGFAETTRVVFVDTVTGKNVDAKFELESDMKLHVIVPVLSSEKRMAPIIVIANGSLTVTLPLTLHVIKPGSDSVNHAARRFKRFESDTTLPYWVMYDAPNDTSQHSSDFIGAEHCVVYAAEPHVVVSSGARGWNTIFLKNNTNMNFWASPDSVIYHEPFANLYDPVMANQFIPDTVRLVPVSAIRPSFVAQPFEYEPVKKAQ